MNENRFNDFVSAMSEQGIAIDSEKFTTNDRKDISGIYGSVNAFLVDNNLVAAEQAASMENLGESIKSFNSEVTLEQLGPSAVADLCTQCNIPEFHMRAAIESVAMCIDNYAHGYDLATHTDESAPSSSYGKFQMRELSSMYSAGAVESMISTPEASVEAFGTYVNNTITDAKVAITVSLLRYHRSAIHRLIPNIPYDSNVLMFKVDHLEMYDLTKSRDEESTVRNDGDHRVPFISLYNDPSPANTELKPILLRTANDAVAPNNKLLSENVILINKEVNMFDLSLDAGAIGYQNVDYTDLVGDNVRIKALYATVTDGTDTELLRIDTLNRATSRLVMSSNNTDSADRSCAMREMVAFDVDTTQSDESASVLLNGLSPDSVIKYNFNAAGSINLKTSIAGILGSADASLATKSGNAIIAGDQTIFDGLTFTLVGGELAANFSEENIRKTTKSMRILTKQVGYEIPGSNNVMVQYSLTQTRPEVVIDGLTKLLSIGADDRGINLMLDNINSVFDQIQSDKALAATSNYTNRVGQAFVAGQRVNPAVYLGNIDIDASVANMRSGELWGDVRGLIDKALMEITVRLFNESYYRQEIGAGEKPVFSVLTSGYIMAALLNIPHYVTALDFKAGEGDSEGAIEFRRILPNGVHLHIVTTTFDYMTDRIMMFPVRPSSPRSVLNYARNAERGTYVAQAAISQQSAVYRQLIANAREIPVVTSPIAALLSITGLTAIFNGVHDLGV